MSEDRVNHGGARPGAGRKGILFRERMEIVAHAFDIANRRAFNFTDHHRKAVFAEVAELHGVSYRFVEICWQQYSELLAHPMNDCEITDADINLELFGK